MVVNGIMIFDDYDCECCPGANAAIDEFFKEKEEKIVTDVIAYIVKK
jgi:hypothetical protein